MLSSINIVEHELYFFVSCPGETLGKKTKQNRNTFKRRDSVGFNLPHNTVFISKLVIGEEVFVDDCSCYVRYPIAIKFLRIPFV